MSTSHRNIFCEDCLETMERLSDGEVNCIVTSPPYWNTKPYSHWPTYAEYMQDVSLWLSGLFRVLEPGRHCFWVIPDKLPYPPKVSGVKERLYLSIYADTERTAAEAGFVCKYPIVWKKPHGTQKMFGSYPFPPTVIHTPMTERICIWRKPGKYIRRSGEVKESSRFTKEQWVAWAQDVWEIRPTSRKDHPAPFPEELVVRILTLWSFRGDLIYDPFIGSGTTAVVATRMGRKFIGSDIHQEYIDAAKNRLTFTPNMV